MEIESVGHVVVFSNNGMGIKQMLGPKNEDMLVESHYKEADQSLSALLNIQKELGRYIEPFVITY